MKVQEYKNKRKKGFTLIEILLTIALFSILVGISIPIFTGFQFSNELDTATSLTTRALRSAQLYSQASLNDSQWGVRVNPGSVILFKGSSYASRDTVADINYPLSTKVSVSGVNEIVFSKLIGDPNVNGNIVFSRFNNSETVNINAKGRITH